MKVTTPRLLAILSAPFVVVLAAVVVATFAIPDVVLHVDRTTYKVGEMVQFSLHNGRSDRVYLSCPAPWQVQRQVNGSWRAVETHICPLFLVPVEAGGTVNWTWLSQTQPDHADLAPVVPGSYRIDLAVMTGCNASGSGCSTQHLIAPFKLE